MSLHNVIGALNHTLNSKSLRLNDHSHSHVELQSIVWSAYVVFDYVLCALNNSQCIVNKIETDREWRKNEMQKLLHISCTRQIIFVHVPNFDLWFKKKKLINKLHRHRVTYSRVNIKHMPIHFTRCHSYILFPVSINVIIELMKATTKTKTRMTETLDFRHDKHRFGWYSSAFDKFSFDRRLCRVWQVEAIRCVMNILRYQR